MNISLGYQQAVLIILLLAKTLYTISDDQELSVVLSSNRASYSIGETDALNCTFNQPVTCNWLRGKEPVQIDGRYKYIQQSNGENTEDCSIRISPIEDRDFGDWRCHTAASDGNTVISEPANLSEQKTLYLRTIVKSTIANIQNGEHTLNEAVVHICSGDNEAVSDYKWEFNDNPTNDSNWRLLRVSRVLTGRFVSGVARCTAQYDERTIYSDIVSFKNDLINGEISCSSMSSPLLTFLGIFAVGLLLLAICLIVSKLGPRKLPWEKRRSKNKNKTLKKSPSFDETEPMLIGENLQQEENSIIAFHFTGKINQNDDEIRKVKDSFQKKVKNYRQKHKKINQRIAECDWTIPKVSEVLELHRRTEELEKMFIQSEPLPVNGTNFNLRIKIYFNGFNTGYGSHVSIALKFENNNVSGAIDDIFYHRRTIMILDQSNVPESEKKHIVYQFEAHLGSYIAEKWMNNWYTREKFAKHCTFEKRNVYIVNNSIKVRVVIEPSEVLANTLTCHYQEYVWTISNYKQKKQNEIDGIRTFLCCEDFYLLPFEYRCKIAVHLNGTGNGDGKGVSAFCGFLIGLFDENLPKKFPHKIKYEILNQNRAKFPEMKNIVRSVRTTEEDLQETNFEKRVPTFEGVNIVGTHDEIEREPFLVSDTIKLRVEILPLTD